MTLKPIGKKVLVRLAEPTEKIGRIFIPDAHRDKVREGTVMFVGDAVTEVLPGERIIFTKYGGTELAIGGLPLLMVREDDILAVTGVGTPKREGHEGSDLMFREEDARGMQI
jgi:chaperonin GroES